MEMVSDGRVHDLLGRARTQGQAEDESILTDLLLARDVEAAVRHFQQVNKNPISGAIEHAVTEYAAAFTAPAPPAGPSAQMRAWQLQEAGCLAPLSLAPVERAIIEAEQAAVARARREG